MTTPAFLDYVRSDAFEISSFREHYDRIFFGEVRDRLSASLPAQLTRAVLVRWATERYPRSRTIKRDMEALWADYLAWADNEGVSRFEREQGAA